MPARPEKPVDEMNFEEALQALQKLVSALEKGHLDLEEAIAMYRRGEALRKHCARKLQKAAAEIATIVAEEDGTITTQPFDISSKRKDVRPA